MATFNNARRILKLDEMRVIKTDKTTYDNGLISGYWENIEPRYLDECIAYLNSADAGVLEDPKFYDIEFSGKLYHLHSYYEDHASYNKTTQRIYRVMSRELNQAAPIIEADTRWRIKKGGNSRGSNEYEVLELPYCDPLYAEEIVKENSEKTYTNSIYTINGGILSGTWHNINCSFVINEQTGRATVTWYLSKQANDDVHFAYTQDDGSFVVDFFKFDAAESGLGSFETDYFFDSVGNWYISDDDGSTYTQKNGVDGTGAIPEGNNIGNMRTEIDGRIASVQITRSEQTRFYMLRARIEFNFTRDYSINYFEDFYTVAAEVIKYTDTEGVDAFPVECQVNSITGDVIVSDTVQGGDYKSLSVGVDGRSASVSSEFDQEQGRYKLTATILIFIAAATAVTWLEDKITRVIDFYVFGATDATLRAALAEYYFNPNGDWFHSSNGTTYDQKNGETASGNLVASPVDPPNDAYNLSQESPLPRAAEVSTQRHPSAPMWVLNARITYANELSGGTTAKYGTPNVTVTDRLVIGAASMPDTTGSIGYNAEGTKETETGVLEPNYSKKDGSFSYLERTIEKWAPHANKATGDAGWIEGPSEIKTEVQMATLARGIGSGFGAAGSWSGGGQVRTRRVEGSDGTGDIADSEDSYSKQTVQITKNFTPYNVSIARSRSVRTTSRFYFFVKEPTLEPVNQYPAAYNEAIADKDAGDIGLDDAPKIVSITVEDDTAGYFGPIFSDNFSDNNPLADTGQNRTWWQDGTTYYGKLTTYTYDDGTFTLVYHGAKYSSAINSETGAFGTYWDNIHWREVKFVRTYPASGTGTGTGYGDGTVKVEYDYDQDAWGDEHQPIINTDEFLAADEGIHMGHKKFTDTAFYPDALRHKIQKLAPSVYALIVEQVEKTMWQWDAQEKWTLNAEGVGMKYYTPPSHPAPTDGAGVSTEPYVL